MLRASPWLCAAKAKARSRHSSQKARASSKPSFDDATFRPRVSNTILNLHSLHKGNKVLDADRRYSAQGQLKAVQQSTISIMPSLYYYLSQRCGIAFDEADALVRAGRLMLDGRPLRATSALAVQVPATIVDKLGIEVVTLRGERVAATDRWRHRYYGLHHKELETRLGAHESDPRAWPLVVQRAEPSDPADVLGVAEPAAGATGGKEAEDAQDEEDVAAAPPPPLYYGDGFDALSNPLPIVPPGFLGGARLGGIMLITNDVSIRPHFTWATGFDATYDLILQRGTPPDIVQRVLEAATECASGKGFAVEGGTVPYKQPSVELRHALPKELDPCVVAGAATTKGGGVSGGSGSEDAWDPTVAAAAADAALAADEPSAMANKKKRKRKAKLRRRAAPATSGSASPRSAHFAVDRAVPYPVIRMNAVTLNRETRQAFLGAGGVCIRATRLALFDLAATGLAPGEFRRLDAAEMRQLVAMDKRHKTRRIISHLRGVAPAPPRDEGGNDDDGDSHRHRSSRGETDGDGDEAPDMWEDMEKPRRGQ